MNAWLKVLMVPLCCVGVVMGAMAHRSNLAISRVLAQPDPLAIDGLRDIETFEARWVYAALLVELAKQNEFLPEAFRKGLCGEANKILNILVEGGPGYEEVKKYLDFTARETK